MIKNRVGASPSQLGSLAETTQHPHGQSACPSGCDDVHGRVADHHTSLSGESEQVRCQSDRGRMRFEAPRALPCHQRAEVFDEMVLVQECLGVTPAPCGDNRHLIMRGQFREHICHAPD